MDNATFTPFTNMFRAVPLGNATATATHGIIVIILVKTARIRIPMFIFRNPSMIY